MYLNSTMSTNSRQQLRFPTSPVFYWACLAILLFSACSEEEEPTPTVDRYEFRVPENFPAPTYTFENNPITKAGFQLGKALFYDPNLSRDGSVSCNNCHIQATAFADSPVHPLSVGVDNRLGIRNAPPLVNMAFFPEFFWDGGVTHLDFVPINAIESEVEMDETVENVVAKLNGSEKYRQLFKEAFDVEEVTLPFALHALSQFTNRMISANSRYDQYIREEGESLSALELEGFSVFKAKCGACHSGELFTDFSYRNNGLDSTFADTGRNRITALESDIGKFRVPSLRNVALTSPYMHNARFGTLEEVLDHYNNGMVYYKTLDEGLIQPDGRLGIDLDASEKEAIIAFLYTLTDTEFTRDTLFFSN
ncbi:MAG: cytochrome c peroxidase [Bacteroidota bacterium]